MTVSLAEREQQRADSFAKFLKSTNSKVPGTVFTESSAPLLVEAIPTGAPSLDFALGVGGVPKGRIIELFGPEGSGKSSLALAICAHAINAGGAAGYLDAEHAMTFEHAKWMGVNTEYLALSQPNSAEETLKLAKEMCLTGAFDVVTVDSVASMVPQAELDGEIGDNHMALLARLMSQTLRQLAGVAAETGTTLLFINQLREKPGATYGNPEYTPGGRALKFYSSVRLDVRSSPSLRIKEGTGDNASVVGQVCKVKVVKNKVAPPFKEAEYRLIFGQGIDASASLLDVAVGLGLWEARPGGMYFDAESQEHLGRGKDNVKKMLSDDPAQAAALTERIQAAMAARKASPVSEPGPAEQP